MQYIKFCSTGHGMYVTCSEAFLFSMVNPRDLGPTKIPAGKGCQFPNVIYCHSGHGPTFGRNHDLKISDNANINTSSSCSSLGFSYSINVEQLHTFFTGDSNFTVTNYEVFGLNF